MVEALRDISKRSRLHEEISTVLGDRHAGRDWDACLDRLDARHPGKHETHILNNAGALAAAILWGDGDVAASIGLAVQAKLDTDSIGATAGSWAGAFRGLAAVRNPFLSHAMTRLAQRSSNTRTCASHRSPPAHSPSSAGSACHAGDH